MIEPKPWTTRRLESAVSSIMGVNNDGAFKARMDNLSRKGLFFKGGSRGRVARYSMRKALDILIAMQLGRIGVAPAIATRAILKGASEIDRALNDEKPQVYLVGQLNALAEPVITRRASARSLTHVYIDLDYLMELLRGQDRSLP